jgi:hypothetical protein
MKKFLTLSLATAFVTMSAFAVEVKKTSTTRDSYGNTKSTTQQRMEDGRMNVRRDKKTYMPADNSVKKTRSTSETTEDMNDTDDY